jgi:hypothetical protein
VCDGKLEQKENRKKECWMDDSQVVSRPLKESHVDTVLYEIDMLDFCYAMLREEKWPNPETYYLHIEGFLLHYRNLANLFANRDGMEARNARDWAQKQLTDSEVASIQDERPHSEYSAQISQYLSHCTETRADRDRDWQPVVMYEALKSCVDNFRKLFPSRPKPRRDPQTLTYLNMSTATMSRYEPDLIQFHGDEVRSEKESK